MPHVLVTGGSGFFGGVLKRRLLSGGCSVVNLDLAHDEDQDGSVGTANLTSIRGDIRDAALVNKLFNTHSFDAVYHCAAQLAHGAMDDKLLWTSNVDGTRILAEAAAAAGVRPFVFLSSNCLWGANLGHPVAEDEPPAPIELYGRSKLEGEKVLQQFSNVLETVIIRCPTILDEGRLGLLAILFEFIDDGKAVWVVGEGDSRYQFIYADDLASACILASRYGKSDLFHIGSDDVPTMRETYQHVIRTAAAFSRAARRSRVRSLPKAATIATMQVAHKLGISPLGPYHYKMIAESFIFDTTRIKNRLGWSPTLTNQEMLLLAYSFYAKNRLEIHARTDASAHRKPTPMGVIRMLKWLS